MQHFLLMLFTVLVLHFSALSSDAAPPAPVPQTSGRPCYNSAGTIIPCAGTGQDGELRNGVAWPTPRFTENSVDTSTDNLSGLMWTKNANLSVSTKTWQGALDYVAGMNAGTYANFGHTDWRVPTIRELWGVSSSFGYFSNLNPACFSNACCYWSSTTTSTVSGSAFILSYSFSSNLVSSSYKSGFCYVLPVRSAE